MYGKTYVDRSIKMDEIERLEQLSLVSKVCTELENYWGLNDKDLGENWRV